MKNKTDSFYQPLFDHMHQEHGLFLLESEMADIILVVRKMDTDEHVVKGMPPLEEPILSDEDMKAWEKDQEKDKTCPQGAVWVKAYNGMPDGIYNMKVASKVSHVIMLGVGSIIGGEIVLITFLNKTTFGKEDAQKEDVTVYYLDESGISTKKGDAVKEVPEWVEWLCDRSPDVPDLSDSTEEEKKLLVDTLFQAAGIQFMKMFYAVGLDKFMESGLVNDSTGDLFRLRFELMQKGHKQEQKEAKP